MKRNKKEKAALSKLTGESVFPHLQPPNLKLNTQRIDIWSFSLSGCPSHYELLLDRQELQKAKRFKFEKHQRRYTQAHAWMRIILAAYLKLSPKKLVFQEGPHGKPYLSHSSNIQFNLSHSGDLALLAVGQKEDLGIDLEFFSSRPFEGIADNLYSETEISFLKTLIANIKPLGFFKIWAQKEAVIKACGLGLRYPTQSFTVSLEERASHRFTDKLLGKSWELLSFMPQIACAAALCYNPSIQVIHYQHLNNTMALAKDFRRHFNSDY